MGSFNVLGNSLYKCVSSSSQSLWISRGFVSATRPSLKANLDKETCQRVIEAAEAVRDGAKEVRSVVQDVREGIASGAGSAMKNVAKKAIEKATEEEEKGTWDKVKDTIIGDKKSK